MDCFRKYFMYSCGNPLRAVLLYINHRKSADITIRQLGYPTKNTLKVWYLAYERSRDFPRVYQRKPKYTAKQRDLAVDPLNRPGFEEAPNLEKMEP